MKKRYTSWKLGLETAARKVGASCEYYGVGCGVNYRETAIEVVFPEGISLEEVRRIEAEFKAI